ncbi:hypothetical protein ZWY2020_058215 [Hordeum vulgare]|nr:hypothetical protein ZWY2020_058215 [Hordeum vulgare]
MRMIPVYACYLEASGNVLDAAIRSFKGYLASDSATTNAGTSSSGVASDVPVMNAPTNSTEWAELIVKEILSASDMNDARNRAFRILEMFDKSAANCSIPDEAQKMREVTNASVVA